MSIADHWQITQRYVHLRHEALVFPPLFTFQPTFTRRLRYSLRFDPSTFSIKFHHHPSRHLYCLQSNTIPYRYLWYLKVSIMFAWVKELLSRAPPQTNRDRQRALKSRRRSLSTDRICHRTKRQDQSPIFIKLPPELRLIVYEMVLCETNQVHIIVKGGKRGSDTTELYGRTCTEPRRYCLPGSTCRVQSQLLLTCRIV